MRRPLPPRRVDRRSLLAGACAAGALALTGCAGPEGRSGGGGEDEEEDEHEEAEVTPGEDLMQEHGVLERVLLVYDEAARRIDAGEALDLAVVGDAAALVRRFVEDYHERLEEELVFPRLEAAGCEVALVATLRRQHERGRQLTDEITRASAAPGGPRLVEALRGFQRMYRPHAAREDTVVFPAFREVVGRGYAELGERFEEREHAQLGPAGFHGAVAEVARLEEALGLADLEQFTPR